MSMVRRVGVLSAVLVLALASVSQAADWVAASSFTDSENKWSGEASAYDFNTNSYSADSSNRTGWGAVLKLNYATAVTSDRVRVSSDFGYNTVDKVRLTVIYSDDTTESHDFDGTVMQDVTFTTLTFTKGAVKSVEFSYHYLRTGYVWWLYELQLYQCPPPAPMAGATLDASSVNATSAVLHGSVTSNGGYPCYGRFKYWATGINAKYTAWRGEFSNSQEFTAAVTELAQNTGYSYQAQLAPTATPAAGDIVTCSATKTFTTVKVDDSSSVEWVSPGGAWAVAGTWANADQAMDDDTTTGATYYHPINGDEWSPYINFSTDLQSNGIRIWASGTNTDRVSIEVLRDGTWSTVYQGVFTGGTWQQFPYDKGLVTQARLKLHAAAGNVGFYWTLMEVDFHQKSDLRTTYYCVGSSWSSAASWSATSGGTGGAGVPGTGCVAVFDANSPSVNLSADVTVEVLRLDSGFAGTLDANGHAITIQRDRGFGALKVAGGELKLGSATHSIKDNFLVTGGTVTAQTSTVVFYAPTDGSFEIGGSVSLNNVKFDPGTTAVPAHRPISITGTLTVNGTLEVDGLDAGGWDLYLNGSGTIVANGSLTGNGKVVRGTVNLTVAGASGDQSQSGLWWGTSGTFAVNKAAGKLVWSGDVKFGDPTMSSSQDTKIVLTTEVDATTNQPTLWLCGYAYGDVNITGDLTAYNVTFYRDGGTGTSCYNLGTSTLTVLNTLTLDMSASGGWHVIFAEGGTIACKGNVVCTSVANADWSGVNFLINGTGNQTVDLGGLSVYKMRVDKASGTVTFASGFTATHELHVTAGNAVNFNAGSVYAVQTLDLPGTTGSPITFRSTTTGTAWKLNVATKYQTPTKVDVKDSDASLGQQIVGTGCVDSGGNTNWRFTDSVFVSFTSGTSSVTSPAWVYGECGPNVTSVQMKVNNGTAFDVVRTSTMKWYADNSSSGGASIGIGLSATAATGLEVIGKDAQNNQQSATQSVTWTATDISQNGSLTIRKGDSLLLTAPGTGQLLIDANGDSTVDYTGQAGDKFAYQYTAAGVYSATAKVGGTTVGTVTVTVVEAILPSLLACQQGSSITRKITINPAAQAANVTVNLSDDGTVNVTTAVVSDGINVTFSTTDIVAPRIFVRIGGAEGPVLATAMVQPFKFVYVGPDVPRYEFYPDGDAKYALTVMMVPFVADAHLKFDTYSGGATFENGSSQMQKNSNDLGAGAYTFYMYATQNWGATCHGLYVIP